MLAALYEVQDGGLVSFYFSNELDLLPFRVRPFALDVLQLLVYIFKHNLGAGRIMPSIVYPLLVLDMDVD